MTYHMRDSAHKPPDWTRPNDTPAWPDVAVVCLALGSAAGVAGRVAAVRLDNLA